MSKITGGWFTYDNYSVFSHVLMPSGFCVSLNFKDYTSGAAVKEALIGRFGGWSEEQLHPKMRSWDGTYTSIDMNFRGNKATIESTDIDGELCILVTPTHRFGVKPMSLMFSGAVLWNMDGYVKLSNDKTAVVGEMPGGRVTVRTSGTLSREMNAGIKSPYVTVTLNAPTVITTGKLISADEARALLDRAKAETEKEAEKFGDYKEAYNALRSCMAWDTIYEPEKGQICTPVSRLWNIGWGGYVLFCWDTYFSAIMSTLCSKELAYANATAITNEVTEDGFVPNFGAANDDKSRDRSQPPVGSFAVLEIYKKFGESEFVASLYDKLLTWNRWYAQNRMIEDGTLCWGSNPYTPRAGKYWETHNIDDRAGAALESGLDNSPMYDDMPFDPDRHIMLLSDVGLTGMYALDCDSLKQLALILGKSDDAAELTARGEKVKDGIDSLWNEEFGMYCNRRVDTREFSLRISPTNFYAMFSDRLPKANVDRMISDHFYNENEFWGEYIIPTIAKNDPAYPDQEYWRGRIWGPTNYLTYLALKKQNLKQPCADMAEKSKALILKEWLDHGHVHENYNGSTGEGCDAKSSDKLYNWGGLLAYIGIEERGER
jgi:Glycogen debranching enzyme